MIRVLARVPDVIQRLGNFLSPSKLGMIQWLKTPTADGLTLTDRIGTLSDPSIVDVSCLTFSGQSWCNLGRSIDLLLGTGSYVVSFWAKASDASNTEYIYAGQLSATDRFYCRYEGGNLRWAIGNKTQTPTVDVASWNHYQVVYNSLDGTGQLLVNGVEVDTMTGVTVDYASSKNIVLGAVSSMNDAFLTGNIALFEIFACNSVASATEDTLVYSLVNEEGRGSLSHSRISSNDDRVMQNGIWNQWIQPVAIEYNGYTYWGSVDSFGGQWVSRKGKNGTSVDSKRILNVYAADDHNCPAVYVDENGIAIFATGHAVANGIVYWDLFTDWGSVGTLTQTQDFGAQGMTYNQVWSFGSRYYWITRADSTWQLLYSEDNMQTWVSAGELADNETAPALYHWVRKVGDKVAIVTYENATQADNVIRYSEIRGGNPDRLYIDSSTYVELDSSLPTTPWTSMDDVVSAGAGEYLRLLDVAEYSGTTYILYLKHQNLIDTEATVHVAYGGFGNWQIEDTGISGGYDVGRYTYYGLGVFDSHSVTPAFILSDYTKATDFSTLSRYELTGGSWGMSSEVNKGTGIRVRPVDVINSSEFDLLWSKITHYTTYTDFIGYSSPKGGVNVAMYTAEHGGGTPPAWAKADGIPSSLRADGFSLTGESDGTSSYANTQISSSDDLEVEVYGRILSRDTNDYFCGMYDAVAGEGILVGVLSTGVFVGYWGTQVPTTYKDDGQYHKHVINNSGYYIDDVKWGDVTGSISTAVDLYIGAQHRSGTGPLAFSNFEYQRIIIRDSGSVVASMLPADGGFSDIKRGISVPALGGAFPLMRYPKLIGLNTAVDALGNPLTNPATGVDNGSGTKTIQTDPAILQGLVVSGTHTGTNGPYSYTGLLGGKPEFYGPSLNVSLFWYSAGDVWRIFHVSTGEIWDNSDTGSFPPKTGWAVGDQGSAAPTISYTNPWIENGEFKALSQDEIVALDGDASTLRSAENTPALRDAITLSAAQTGDDLAKTNAYLAKREE